MNALEVATRLGFEIYSAKELAEGKEIKGCYIGDLLSHAMSKVQENDAWITIQTNINIVAVASLADAGCIIVADGCLPEESTIKKAEEQGVVVFGSQMSAYKIAVAIGELGV